MAPGTGRPFRAIRTEGCCRPPAGRPRSTPRRAPDAITTRLTGKEQYVCDCRSLSLKPTVAAPRQARAAIGHWVHQWDLDEVSDLLLLILSELVTNAVVHAGTPI